MDAILVKDEYRFADIKFNSSDVIIDIGAHIGIFSFICYLLGSRKVISFESNKINYKKFKSYLKNFKGINIVHKAVFRSDTDFDGRLLSSPMFENNSGSHSVIMGGKVLNYEDQKLVDTKNDINDIEEVEIIGLDDILRNFESVKLLKLDCEGSEYPILFSSKQLFKVERIVGEYHIVDEKNMSHLHSMAVLPNATSYTPDFLKSELQAKGFEVNFISQNIGNGIFEAINKNFK